MLWLVNDVIRISSYASSGGLGIVTTSVADLLELSRVSRLDSWIPAGILLTLPCLKNRSIRFFKQQKVIKKLVIGGGFASFV